MLFPVEKEWKSGLRTVIRLSDWDFGGTEFINTVLSNFRANNTHLVINRLPLTPLKVLKVKFRQGSTGEHLISSFEPKLD